MKRKNRLMEQIADQANLRLAFWKAKRGKEAKREVVSFSTNLKANLDSLRNALIKGNINTGNPMTYNQFYINDPKRRLICAAPFEQRVLHHALMNVCGPLMDSRQVAHSYACRTGKGTYAALVHARNMCTRYDWCAKMDVRKYFDSVSHAVLKRQLAAFFKEPALLTILYEIIDSYETEDGKGLPIGNLTSQYFANHYLSGLDHAALEQFGVRGYARYMDDILIFGQTRADVAGQVARMREYANKNLGLEFKLLEIRRTTQATPFLGYRISRHRTLLGRRSKARYKAKLRLYMRNLRCGLWNQETLRRHLSPLIAFTLKADSTQFRKNVLKHLNDSS